MSAKPQLNPRLKLALDLGPLLVFFFANSRPALFEPLLKPFFPAALQTGEHAGIFAATAVFIPTVAGARRRLCADAAPAADAARSPRSSSWCLAGYAHPAGRDLHQAQADHHLSCCSPACCSAGLLSASRCSAMVFDQVFHLTEEGWRKLTLRWALFFLGLAVLNEIVWRTQIDRHLGGVQGVRRGAADLRVRGAAISAADEIRRQPKPGTITSNEPRGSGSTALRASALSIAGISALLQILRRDRPDQLVGDAAVAADHERFRHAIDAPFDRGAAVGVGADRGERIAVAAEEAPGVVRLVLVVDADEADALVRRRASSAAAPRRGRARTTTPRH